MRGALVLCKRDLRKFIRQPTMMFATIVVPFILLILIGYAFGGTIAHVPIAVVQYSYGDSSNGFLDIIQAEQSCLLGGSGCQNSFQLIYVSDLGRALSMLREGSVKAVVYIPLDFDRSTSDHDINVYIDTTDPLSAGAISNELTQARQQFSLNQQALSLQDQPVNIVQSSIYRNVLYIEFMAPGSVASTILFVALIGGGITILNDRERGVIEGYLATPLKSYEIVLGVVLAGVVKAILSAGTMLLLAVLIAGVRPNVDPLGLLLMTLTLVLASLGMLSLVTAIAVRAPSADMLRFTILPLSYILFFTSGAVYPIQGFPAWMKAFATVNPMTYTVHALRLLMYKGSTIAAVIGDFTFLIVFTGIMLVIATLVFRRSL
jgi:ABC-2 type transport system permease protein